MINRKISRHAANINRRWNPIRRWRLRAGRWHHGIAHHEMVCSYDEWLAAQSRRQRRAHRRALARIPEIYDSNI